MNDLLELLWEQEGNFKCQKGYGNCNNTACCIAQKVLCCEDCKTPCDSKCEKIKGEKWKK